MLSEQNVLSKMRTRNRKRRTSARELIDREWFDNEPPGTGQSFYPLRPFVKPSRDELLVCVYVELLSNLEALIAGWDLLYRCRLVQWRCCCLSAISCWPPMLIEKGCRLKQITRTPTNIRKNMKSDYVGPGIKRKSKHGWSQATRRLDFP